MLTSSRRETDGVLFVERANELRVKARLSASGAKPQGKRVLRGRISFGTQTRNRVIYPWPGRSAGKAAWRAEPVSVEKGSDELRIAVKFQSNTEIAGSPRNSFRASVVVSLTGVSLWFDEGADAYRFLPNRKYRQDVHGSQTAGDKLRRREGKSPDRPLRPPRAD